MVPIENEKKRINWNEIRAEFISGVSYGILSKKYHVSKSTIHKHAQDGDWRTLRTEAANQARTLSVQRTAEAAADNAALAASIKRQGLEILAKLFADFAKINATEHRESSQGVTDVKRLRDLTAAYKDLTEGLTETGPDKNAPIYDLLRKLDGECDV